MTKNTAVAIVLGVDPRAYLNAKGDEASVLMAAMNRAAELLFEQRKKDAEAIGASCATAIGRMFRKRSSKRSG